MRVNAIRLLSGVNNNFTERLATNETGPRRGLPVDAWPESVRGQHDSPALKSPPEDARREGSRHEWPCQPPSTPRDMIQSFLSHWVVWAKPMPYERRKNPMDEHCQGF
jgi:hypothetical protein